MTGTATWGPSHASCNRATTPRVIYNNGLNWPRRWFEDAPEGTIVGNREVRRGGRWEPL
jgi:hypothetical protein